MKENKTSFNGKKTAQDILQVSASNIVKLFAGVLAAFVLPKIIGVTDYGYYKTFTLYATYIGLFHFGLSDGIYLQYGGVDYERLDKSKFRFYTSIFYTIEIVIALVIAVLSMTAFTGDTRFIIACLSVYLVFHNGTSYYQSISQITSRFKELSQRNLIQSLLTTFTILLLWAVYTFGNSVISYRVYLICYIGIAVLLALWYIYTYRDITFGSIEVRWDDITHFIKIGLPLMVANLCSSLILTLDRQFVSILFTTEVYAIYAFAYNMLSLVTTATSAVSTVLYPNLKKIDETKLKSTYTDLITAILIFTFFCMLIFFPLSRFVTWFLPKYIGSIIIFRIIFPGLAVSSTITVVMHNYYKAIGQSTLFFKKCVLAIIVTAISNYAAYLLFETTVAISVASIITLVFWYILVEHYFWGRYKVQWKKNFIYMLSMMGVFYLVTMISNDYIAFGLYTCIYLLFTFMFFKERIMIIIGNR